MHRAVCPGSFDPVTNGHLDVIGRAAALYDEVVVAVLVNESKAGLFTIDERLEMLVEVTKHYPNVTSRSFRGLLVDFCRANDIPVVIRGLRVASDFDYELQMAQMNEAISGIQTVFVPCASSQSFLSSSLIRDIARLGGADRVEDMVPHAVSKRLKEKFGDR